MEFVFFNKKSYFQSDECENESKILGKGKESGKEDNCPVLQCLNEEERLEPCSHRQT